MGEYNHTIDPKGRVIVPVKFREKLGDSFVVTKGLDNCLQVMDEKEWNKFSESFISAPYVDPDARKFTRFMFAGATDVEVDKQGRILIPQNLREYAGLTKDVVLVGIYNKVEIWSKERWDAANENIDIAQISQHMQTLGLGI